MYFDQNFIKKLFRYGILVLILLVLLDLLTFFFYPKTVLGDIFLATREQTPLTWVSSTILLIVGLTCASAYFKTKNKVWYFLSLTYLFFSMDDAIYFHERFTGSLQRSSTLMQQFPSYSWVILYFPLLAFGLLGLVYMLWKDASKKDRTLFIYSVLFLSFALLLDMVDGFVDKDPTLVFSTVPRLNSSITHIFRLLEETLEVVAFGLLAYLNLREHNVKKTLFNK